MTEKESSAPKLTLYQGPSEWSALYGDGALLTVGAHYHADDKIYELCGVEVIQSNDFMRGGHAYDDVAQTLADIVDYTIMRQAAEQEATGLEAEARSLQERARQLRAGAGR